jgi:hypothetical protein
MPIQALQVLERKIERQIRLFELRNRALGRKLERKLATQKERIGQKFDAHKLRIEQQFDAQKKRFESHIRRFELKNGIRIDDEFRFFRTPAPWRNTWTCIWMVRSSSSDPALGQ